MALPALLAPVLGWVFRTIVLKFIIFTGLFLLFSLLVPWVVGWLAPFILPDSLTAAFAQLPADLWFWLDLFQLQTGVPLLISAFVARFLIRRVPGIG